MVGGNCWGQERSCKRQYEEIQVDEGLERELAVEGERMQREMRVLIVMRCRWIHSAVDNCTCTYSQPVSAYYYDKADLVDTGRVTEVMIAQQLSSLTVE